MLETVFDRKCLKPFFIINKTWHFLVTKYDPKKKTLKETQKYESNIFQGKRNYKRLESMG